MSGPSKKSSGRFRHGCKATGTYAERGGSGPVGRAGRAAYVCGDNGNSGRLRRGGACQKLSGLHRKLYGCSWKLSGVSKKLSGRVRSGCKATGTYAGRCGNGSVGRAGRVAYVCGDSGNSGPLRRGGACQKLYGLPRKLYGCSWKCSGLSKELSGRFRSGCKARGT